jgi:hypothetical protein
VIFDVASYAKKERLSSEELGQVVPFGEKSRNDLLGVDATPHHARIYCCFCKSL